ncbi:hypothetical protein [Burkholderia sp. MBR-1]|uniref:hypothetical protein n=1 Tax=Burkholderia sp. MBR-1 TaxID=2732364 RepID=UPI0015EE84F6|nr:hypothetical protein [Burkholderia sp. MBR-1]QMI49889.1 hypothetical protein MBR110_31000 [Burkholderia sp. MBR-1]
MPAFNTKSIPVQKRCRWFVRQGATTHFTGGFRSKVDASNWIDAFGASLDWRVGFRFRLKGDTQDIEIVDRLGNTAQP